MLITVGDDPLPWAKCEGGEAGHDVTPGGTVHRTFTDLVLHRFRADNTCDWLNFYADQVGRRTTVTLAHHRPDGGPTGSGLRYEGVIARVIPATADANSNAAAVDRLVVAPAGLEAFHV